MVDDRVTDTTCKNIEENDIGLNKMSNEQRTDTTQNLIHDEQKQVIGGIFLATLYGAIIRSFFIFQADFPLNDGGMFYTMVRNLQAVSFKLPLFTTYNNANIPFAYPPLPFYLAGVLNTFLKVDLIQLLRYLPLIFSILTIPAFYLLTTQLVKTKPQQVIATFIFAMIPTVYTWEIMGGGLTRSPAFFFTLLSLTFFIRYQKGHGFKDLIWTVVFSSLTTLCHLEMIYMLAISYVIIVILFNRNWKCLIDLALIALGVLVLSSEWWLTVLLRFGVTPFGSAMSNGGINILSPFAFLLSMDAIDNARLSFITVLALIGVGIVLKNHERFLPVWILALIFLDPRSSQRSAAIPLAMLAAIALEAIFVWLNEHSSSERKVQIRARYHNLEISSSVKLVAGLILFFALFNNLFSLYQSDNVLKVLNHDNRDAMQWVKENTSLDSQFLVLDFPSGWHTDLVGEWFPTLTLRTSVLTAQGKEWLPDQIHGNLINELSKISECRFSGVSCLEDWQTDSGVLYDYFYITSNTQNGNEPGLFTSSIDAEMSHLNDYQLVYSNSDVRIYKNK